MKRSRFTQDQIFGILKKYRRTDLCSRHGITDAIFYTWWSKYGGIDVSEARRLKALEDESRIERRLTKVKPP